MTPKRRPTAALAAAASVALVAGGMLWWQASEDVTPVEVANPTEESAPATNPAAGETLLVSPDDTGELLPITDVASQRQQFQVLGNSDPDATVPALLAELRWEDGRFVAGDGFEEVEAIDASARRWFFQGDDYGIDFYDNTTWEVGARPGQRVSVRDVEGVLVSDTKLQWRHDANTVVSLNADLSPEELVALANSLVETPEPGQDVRAPVTTAASEETPAAGLAMAPYLTFGQPTAVPTRAVAPDITTAGRPRSPSERTISPTAFDLSTKRRCPARCTRR